MWLVVKLKIASLPKGSNWLSVYGVALLTGIGSTMSLFIGSLAFERGAFDQLAAPRASAIEPLTAIQLEEVCRDAVKHHDSPEARLCVYYVKGFLDGAVATDARVAENVASEIEEQETHAERAIRTRVINRVKESRPTVYAEFCVGQPDPIADVVLHVIEELDRHENLEGLQAQTLVYASLRRHYPCKAT